MRRNTRKKRSAKTEELTSGFSFLDLDLFLDLRYSVLNERVVRLRLVLDLDLERRDRESSSRRRLLYSDMMRLWPGAKKAAGEFQNI